MENKRLEEIIRVDHAGEHGATSIYKGTIDVLNILGDEKTKKIISEMAEGEIAHVKEFDNLIRKKSIRPTAFLPFWKLTGYSLGAITALAGKDAIMACTEAVEEVIDKHYSDQIKEIEESKIEREFLFTLKKFHSDEVEHKTTAEDESGKNSVLINSFKEIVKIGCKGAIKISEKI